MNFSPQTLIAANSPTCRQQEDVAIEPPLGPSQSPLPSGTSTTSHAPASNPVATTPGESLYVWDLASDELQWEEGATAVLGLDGIDEISAGERFEKRIVAEHRDRRMAAISEASTSTSNRGAPYRIQYRFRSGARRAGATIWLEEEGHWWPGEDGRPALAHGTVRIVEEGFVTDQDANFGSDCEEFASQLDRTRLPQAVAATLARCAQRRASSAFVMIALNNLSAINETFGFDVGDEVLAATAGLVKEQLRTGDVVGRYSCDKLGVILANCGPGAMRIAAERFISIIRDTPIRTSRCQLTATISIGGVSVPEHASTVREVFTRSLHALELAKAQRNESFVSFEPDSELEAVRQQRIAIADEIMAALDENRLRLVLQPIINARTRQPDFYECLLRMGKPDGSTASAGEIVPFAEKFGLLRLIDKRTLELAVSLLRRYPRLSLSVNVSSLTTSDQDWLRKLRELTGDDRTLTNRLILEITETKVIHDLDQAIAFVDTLRELGCRVAIDDFGAGYTSFKNLKHLPVDLVKIDGAFVKNLAVDSCDKVFIKTMVELAETFGMQTVAEWVGDEETARLLTDAGITYLQGFHFGQPIAESELPAGL